MKEISRDNGIDQLFREKGLNVLVFPMDSLMVFMSAASGEFGRRSPLDAQTADKHTGYPLATMPAGVIPADGRPYGIGVMAQAGMESLLFQFMSAFEAHSPPRGLPSRVHDALETNGAVKVA